MVSWFWKDEETNCILTNGFIIPCDQYDLWNTTNSSRNGHLKHKTESLAPGRGQSTWLLIPPQFCSWTWIENKTENYLSLYIICARTVWGNVSAIAVCVTDLLLLTLRRILDKIISDWYSGQASRLSLLSSTEKKVRTYLSRALFLPEHQFFAFGE